LLTPKYREAPYPCPYPSRYRPERGPVRYVLVSWDHQHAVERADNNRCWPWATW
jgi:hypothetical protein